MARRTNWIDDLQYIMWCKAWGHRFKGGRYCVWCGIRRHPYAFAAVLGVVSVAARTFT